MSGTRKTPSRRGPSRPKPRGRRPSAPTFDDVTVRLSFVEAGLMVAAACLAKDMASQHGSNLEDPAIGDLAGSVIDKLHRASPTLKRETKVLERDIRTFLAQETDYAGDDADGFGLDPDPDDDMDGDGEPVLKGQGWLDPVQEAMEAGQEIVLRTGSGRSRRERRLQPVGAGHVGNVAVAIGWSPDTMDFAAVRLDQVDSMEETGTSFNDGDGDLSEACLKRFDRLPRD